MMLNTKFGVTLLALYSASCAYAKDDTKIRKRTLQKNLRKGNRRLATKGSDRKAGDDITEDVAFWTRTLQAGSIPPRTREPTKNPTRRPTPNPTRRPTPNPTKSTTPNPTKRPTVATTPNPTKRPTAAVTPNPTSGSTPVPTPIPTFVDTPQPTLADTPQPTLADTPNPTEPPVPAPTPVSGPVARDDSESMLLDDVAEFFSVLDNDTPAPGESLIVQSVQGGPNCVIALSLVEVVYQPTETGTFTCVYEACDSVLACDTATLTVTVM